MRSLTASIDTKPSVPASSGPAAARFAAPCRRLLIITSSLWPLIAAPSFRPRRSKPRGISSPRASSSRPRSLGKRPAAAQLAELQALLSTERAALNRSDRLRLLLSGAFHIAVAATSGEGVLTAFLRSLISRSSLVIALYGRSHASACGHDEHIALVSALGNREAQSAARLMSDHLDHIFSDLDLNIREDKSVDLAAVLGARPGRNQLTTVLHRRARPAPGGGYAKGHIG